MLQTFGTVPNDATSCLLVNYKAIGTDTFFNACAYIAKTCWKRSFFKIFFQRSYQSQAFPWPVVTILENQSHVTFKLVSRTFYAYGIRIRLDFRKPKGFFLRYIKLGF